MYGSKEEIPEWTQKCEVLMHPSMQRRGSRWNEDLRMDGGQKHCEEEEAYEGKMFYHTQNEGCLLNCVLRCL